MLRALSVGWCWVIAAAAGGPVAVAPEPPPQAPQPASAPVARDQLPLGDWNFYPSRQRPVGLRGDGSGCFPGAAPVLDWSDGTIHKLVADPEDPRQKRDVYVHESVTRNILWKAPLPNWSDSSPVVVGDKVFLLSEPTCYAPQLLCLSARTGRLLWSRDVDRIDLLPREEAKGVREDWISLTKLARSVARLHAEQNAIERAMKSQGDDPAVSALRAAWDKEMAALGIKSLARQSYTQIAATQPILTPAQGRRIKDLYNTYGIMFLRHNVGFFDERRIEAGIFSTQHSFPTPVSDGKYVWTYNAYNTAACYDLQGNLAWMKWLGPVRMNRWTKEKGANDTNFYNSPLLIGNRLIIAYRGSLVALEADTGKLLWEADADEKVQGVNYVVISPVRVRLGAEDLVLWMDGRLYRLTDGKWASERILGDDYVYDWGCTPVVRDDVAFIHAHKDGVRLVVAVKLSLKGDGSVAHQRVWESKSTPGTYSYDSPLCAKGRVFAGRAVYDAVSGKCLATGLTGSLAMGGYQLAGNHVFADVREGNYVLAHSVYDLKGGAVSKTLMGSEQPTPARLRLIREQTGRDEWGEFGYAAPCFAGDRIYIRSHDYLICIGDPMVRYRLAKPLPPTSPADLPALIAKLGDADSEERSDALDRLAALGHAAATAVDAIGKAMLEDEDDVACAALRALRSMPADGAKLVPQLLTALKGPDRQKAQRAFMALRALGAEAQTTLPAIVPFVNNQEPNCFMKSAAGDLCKSIGPEAAKALMAAIKKDPKGVGYAALEILGQMGTGAEPVLAGILDAGVGNGSEASALIKLGPAAQPVLAKVLERKWWNVAVAIDPQSVVPVLPELTKKAANEDRSAIEILGRMGSLASSAAPEVVKVATTTKDTWTRGAAFGALEAIGTSQTVESLKPFADGEDEAMANAARKAIDRITDRLNGR